MIKQYCYKCKKETYHTGHKCSYCIEKKYREDYSKDFNYFHSLSLEDKLNYLFNIVYKLKKKSSNFDINTKLG